MKQTAKELPVCQNKLEEGCIPKGKGARVSRRSDKLLHAAVRLYQTTFVDLLLIKRTLTLAPHAYP